MAETSITRPDPEQLLRRVQAEEQQHHSGRLKIFLGYAGGVGKSFRMLDEGRRRRQRGEDVVVGAVQQNTSPEVEAVLQSMEVIPFRIIEGKPVMDVETILHRHPQVCLVDSLAYDNPPGSPNLRRWQDVDQLLAAGISVITSVNLKYIEEQREKVQRITGKPVAQTVPQSFLSTADEIEVVDAPPERALQRAGSVGLAAGAESEQQLSELREIALLLAAEVVDRQLERYLERRGIEQFWGTQERILVWVTPHADAAAMVASGRRNADRFHGELFVAYVSQPDLMPADHSALEQNLSYARHADAQIESLDGEDQVETIIRFARSRGITQVFVAQGKRESFWERIFGSAIDRLIRSAVGIDVRVFPQ